MYLFLLCRKTNKLKIQNKRKNNITCYSNATNRTLFLSACKRKLIIRNFHCLTNEEANKNNNNKKTSECVTFNLYAWLFKWVHVLMSYKKDLCGFTEKCISRKLLIPSILLVCCLLCLINWRDDFFLIVWFIH